MIHYIALNKFGMNLTCYIETYDYFATWDVFDSETEGIDFSSKGYFKFNKDKELIEYDGSAPSFIENEISKLGYIIN